MANLLNRTIKLAQQHPELRGTLVPLIEKHAGPSLMERAKGLFQRYKKEHPGTKKSPEDFKGEVNEPKGEKVDPAKDFPSQAKRYKADMSAMEDMSPDRRKSFAEKRVRTLTRAIKDMKDDGKTSESFIGDTEAYRDAFKDFLKKG